MCLPYARYHFRPNMRPKVLSLAADGAVPIAPALSASPSSSGVSLSAEISADVVASPGTPAPFPPFLPLLASLTARLADSFSLVLLKKVVRATQIDSPPIADGLAESRRSAISASWRASD